MTKISDNLQKLMAFKKLNASQLAALSNVNHSYITKILRGKQPLEKISFGVLEKLAAKLDVLVADLTGEMKHAHLSEIRRGMSALELKIIDALLSMEENDERRKLFLRLLEMDSGNGE